MTSHSSILRRPAPLRRRAFLIRSLSLGAGGALAVRHAAAQAGSVEKPAKLKAAIIGHTGRGDYGHEHDLIFNPFDHIEVAAVADPDTAGREKAARRARALRQYAEYREMLKKEQPQLVCVAPRWTDQHHAMAKAALEHGAHVYLEKPFTQTLAEADDLLAAAKARNLRMVVAHQMRLAPSIQHLKKELAGGVIGELLEIRAHGKQDRRAGAEDMIVLGTHLFDLIRFFAGDARWCSARVLQQGRDITRGDAHPATENIGPIAGDEVQASFALESGVNVSFTSRGKYRQTAGPWGMDLVGSSGVIRILTEIVPKVFLRKAGEWSGEGRTVEWRPLPGDPTLKFTASDYAFGPANRRLVEDWLEAIETGRDPVCSGHHAMKSLEMIMAVFEAGLSGKRVPLPLANREHPLRS